MLRAILTLAFALSALPATAQVVMPCDDRPAQIKAPAAQHSRTFANGNVTLSVLQVEGPAYAVAYLRVEIASSDTCRFVGREERAGWATIWWDDLDASYDPARGLVFKVPAHISLRTSAL